MANERKLDGGRSNLKPVTFISRLTNSLDRRYQRQLLLVLLALTLTFIIIPKGGFAPGYYQSGDVASRDIKAPRELLVPDEGLTQKKRQQAEEAVPVLYDFDSGSGVNLINRLHQVLELGQTLSTPGSTATAEVLKPSAERILGVALEPGEWSALLVLSAAPDKFIDLKNLLASAYARKVVSDIGLLRTDSERGILLRDMASGQDVPLRDTAELITIEKTRASILSGMNRVYTLSKVHRQALAAVLEKSLRPNLTFNKSATEARKKDARDAVTTVLYQVKQGEMIVREGERITDSQLLKLDALRKIGSDSRNMQTAFGLLLSTLILIFVSHRFANRNIRKYNLNNRDLLFMATTFVGLFILIKLAIFVASALESAFPYIESTSYYYVVPFAVGAMLVRIVLNSEVTVFFAVLASLLIGVLFGNNLFLTFYAFAGSLTAAHWVRHCKERAMLYRAGLRLSLVNILMIVAIHFLASRGLDLQLLYKCGFALANGLICAVIVTGIVPMVEHFFKYTTDIKLLELANMNSPVLRELMVQAPGTYHHSVIVGNLVEAAAEEINANPLLARVAAYYHDIGKIRKPLYYIENVGIGENRHDKLAPSMSALILMAHLKDGVDIAREHKLGEPIVDIIRQHHGTGLIKFFYEKAKNQANANVQQISERDYRYPGPKPQTREAALIMLADAVEAASRTLTDPTPARIRGMVQKLINNIFIDGQLDECELTLKDLHKIARSFERVLSGIFHHRVDYPEPVYKERVTEKKNGDDSDRERAAGSTDKNGSSEESGPADLKRLGMS